jgi:hypothetical protein
MRSSFNKKARRFMKATRISQRVYTMTYTNAQMHLQALSSENGRLVFDNGVRDLSPDIARNAVFIIKLASHVRDGREPAEQIVAGCEGDRCSIRTLPALDPIGGVSNNG